MHYACESEDVFRNFAKNIELYGSDLFIGTCSDGESIYSLLLGKRTHIFQKDGKIAGSYTKLFEDRPNWIEEFGMPVEVMLESFDKPQTEFLVPFTKITDILKEVGFDLVETHLFKDIYSNQKKTILQKEEQTFSFLNRSFVFKKGEKAEPAPEPAPEPASEPASEPQVKQKKTRKLKKSTGGADGVDGVDGVDGIEILPILFFGPNENEGIYNSFSPDSQHPISIDGTTYPTLTHFLHNMKAKVFEDSELADKIVNAKTPKAVKAMKVKNFNSEIWKNHEDDLLHKAYRAKCSQHPTIRKLLMESKEQPIGYADPRDVLLGIGSAMGTPKSESPEKWRGQNKIGKTLEKVRADFIQDL